MFNKTCIIEKRFPILLLLRSNPTRQHSKVPNIAEGQKRKDWKTRKSRHGEKVVGFSLASLLPARKREADTQGGTKDRPPDAEENPGSRYHQKLGGQETAGGFQIHSRKTKIARPWEP